MTDTGYKDRLGNHIEVGDIINCYHIFSDAGNPLGNPIPRKVNYYPELKIFGCLQDSDCDHVIDLRFLHCNSFKLFNSSSIDTQN
jgi:hypothetical protein